MVELGCRLDLAGQVPSLQEELASYRAAVVAHGVVISGLDAHLRAEPHLDVLPPVQD